MLISAALPILGCRDRAEDVIQDAYFKVSEITEPEIRQPTSYLFQLVRNLAIDRSRRIAYESRHSAGSDTLDHVACKARTPEECAIHCDSDRFIRSVLAELPPRTRAVFDMYRSGQYKQKEIAQKFAISPTLLHFLLRDAMTHCRNRLAETLSD